MDLTISIVNWNVKEYLKKSLNSIFRYSSGITLEVIVVDNASSDGSVDMVKKEFPGVIVIENKENEGYGSAHNRSIEKARGRYLLFLNPDTEMLPDTLLKTIEFMDSHQKAGACNCREIPYFINEYIVLSNYGRFFMRLFWRLNKLFYNPFISNLILNFFVRIVRLTREIREVSGPEGIEGGIETSKGI